MVDISRFSPVARAYPSAKELFGQMPSVKRELTVHFDERSASVDIDPITIGIDSSDCDCQVIYAGGEESRNVHHAGL